MEIGVAGEKIAGVNLADAAAKQSNDADRAAYAQRAERTVQVRAADHFKNMMRARAGGEIPNPLVPIGSVAIIDDKLRAKSPHFFEFLLAAGGRNDVRAERA